MRDFHEWTQNMSSAKKTKIHLIRLKETHANGNICRFPLGLALKHKSLPVIILKKKKGFYSVMLKLSLGILFCPISFWIGTWVIKNANENHVDQLALYKHTTWPYCSV